MEKLKIFYKKNSLLMSIILLVVFISLVTVGIFVLKGTTSKNDTKINSDGTITYNVATPYPAPEISGIAAWINSNALKISDLKGKVVVIDFWTYSCINCLRTLPYITSWYDKYKDDGLVVIGVHSPEFSFEKQKDNVQKAVSDNNIHYPVAMDNDLTTWGNFKNQYWPATYFIDRNGNVRHTHFGEGMYTEDETVIRQLIIENGSKLNSSVNKVTDATFNTKQSPETYINYSRGQNFANVNEFKQNQSVNYTLNTSLFSNQWTLGGNWTISSENTTSESDGVVLKYKFSAKEVYLVMGADQEKTVSVKINGNNIVAQNIQGSDVGSDNKIKVQYSRLYKILKSPDFLQDAELELTFQKGINVNAFTFG